MLNSISLIFVVFNLVLKIFKFNAIFLFVKLFYMKKYLYLFLSVFLISSCAEDVKFNNPAFQTLKDNVFWRAQSYEAYITATGNLVIEGQLGFEKVTLQTASPSQQTFVLGQDDISKASYSNTLPEVTEEFTTGVNSGNGQIIITDYNAESSTISGTFKFTAVNSNTESAEKKQVHFSEGVFYKVPVAVSSDFVN
jgi:PBP1b-binding outer membrane lipoprotein LpoB